MTDIVEIIDLTSPTPSLAELPEPESGIAPSQNPTSQETETRVKKKKRRTKKKSANATPEITPRESRANSQERTVQVEHIEPEARVKRKRKSSPSEDRGERSSRRARKAAEEVDDKDTADLFFVDVAPAPIPPVRQPLAEVPDTTNTADAPVKLLVPAHVTVLGRTPVEIIQPLSEGEEEEDFIDYLDYDDTRHIVRYYDDAPKEAIATSRTVCKNCGAEGDHKTSACTVQICLTCGVRNEHSTRSCPISKVCFTCGMKGHINANCPNRLTARTLQSSRELECDRCSSSRHKANECPTVWRLYEYFSVEEQVKTVALRQSKKDLKLGDGGEGYVADDDWCYNCGQWGHWGDDCTDVDTSRWPEEHSAFSIHNVMKGPFYDPENQPRATTSRSRVRDWENGEDTSAWGKDAPSNVGRQGRLKSRAALEKQARQVDDEEDDWFGNNNSRRSNGSVGRGPARNSSKPTFTFGRGVAPGRQYAPPTDSGPPSLLSRMSDPNTSRHNHRDRDRDSRSRNSHHSSSRSSKRDYQEDSYGSSRDSRRRRDDRSSSNHHYSDNRRHYSKSGPRYSGGYEAR